MKKIKIFRPYRFKKNRIRIFKTTEGINKNLKEDTRFSRLLKEVQSYKKNIVKNMLCKKNKEGYTQETYNKMIKIMSTDKELLKYLSEDKKFIEMVSKKFKISI